MKKKFLMSISVMVIVFVFIFSFIFYLAKNLQKETCKKTIEYSLPIAINLKKVELKTSVDENWKELGTYEQRQFLEYLQSNKAQYTECLEYPYLIEGKAANGNILSFFVRKENLSNLEIRLGDE